jgi:hypothetical protein
LTSCNGSDSVVTANTECNIPIATLRAAPFSLPWGELVYAKVQAHNAYGASGYSDAGCCGRIVTNPDPPINLKEEISGRTISTLGISWQQASFNGGDVILDYRVWMNDGRDAADVFTEIATGLQQTSIVATGLQYGVIYTFKVESRNSYDYSDFSQTFSLLCAIEPDQIVQPTTTISLDKVIVDWSAPNDHGSPITSYRVFIQAADGTWHEETISCSGDPATTECAVSSFDLIVAPWNLLKDSSVNAYI